MNNLTAKKALIITLSIIVFGAIGLFVALAIGVGFLHSGLFQKKTIFIFMALIMISFTIFGAFSSYRFFITETGQRLALARKVLLVAIVSMIVISVLGSMIPNKDIVVGFEGGGHTLSGRGFPRLAWFRGTSDATVNYFSGAADGYQDFRKTCQKTKGVIKKDDVSPGIASAPTCVYENGFSIDNLVHNSIMWSLVGFLFALMVVVRPFRKVVSPNPQEKL